jgi:GTP-binding protein EngB required for normal cell division
MFLIVRVLYLTIFLISSALADECPDHYVLLNNRCYFFSVDEKNWVESRNACSVQESTLVRIDNLQTNNQIYDQITESHWIGFHNFYQGTWQWVDGQKQDYKNWGTGEPNNFNHGGVGENCAELCRNSDHCPNGKWNDYLCSRKLKFICQRKKLSSQERLEKSCQEIKKNGFKGTDVNVAFTGEGGVGKSSMINSLRGLKEGDDGAAPTSTGVIGTTASESYPLSKEYDFLKFWDLPGGGVSGYPSETYYEDRCLDLFDGVLLFDTDRPHELTSSVLQKAKRDGILDRFVVVYTKTDRGVSEILRRFPHLDRSAALRDLKDTVTKSWRENLQKVIGDDASKVALYFTSAWELIDNKAPVYDEGALFHFLIRAVGKRFPGGEMEKFYINSFGGISVN